jgi:hypothetical protein
VANLLRRENTRKIGLRNPARTRTHGAPPANCTAAWRSLAAFELWRPLRTGGKGLWHKGLLSFGSVLPKAARQMTWRSLAVLENLANSFRKGTEWTRQITGSVDLSETGRVMVASPPRFGGIVTRRASQGPR